MTRLFSILTLLILTVSLTSCFNATEEIWIESDGSGRMEIESDLSNLYPFLMMGLESEAEKPQEEGEEQSFEKSMMALLSAEEVDTVLSMRSMFESAMAEEGMSEDQFWQKLEQGMNEDDSMPQDQKEAIFEMVQTFMNMDFRLQANQAKQLFKTTSIQHFEETSDITSWVETIQSLVPLMADGENGPDAVQLEAMDDLFGSAVTRYEVDGNYLRVSRSGMDLDSMGEEGAETMAMLKMFMGNAPYRLIIHLPGKVKSIDHPDAEKLDKRTVALEIPMEDLLDPEKSMELNIKFKAPRSMRN